jgi:hypothetical protein
VRLWNTQQIGDIGSTWAGGADGMRVTDIVLDMLPVGVLNSQPADIQLVLSPKGRFYLVAVEQNKPLEIIARMKALGLDGSVSEQAFGTEGRSSSSVERGVRCCMCSDSFACSARDQSQVDLWLHRRWK